MKIEEKCPKIRAVGPVTFSGEQWTKEDPRFSEPATGDLRAAIHIGIMIRADDVWITARSEKIAEGGWTWALEQACRTHMPGDVAVRPSPWWPLFISVVPCHRPCYHVAVGRERQPITTPSLYFVERHGRWVPVTRLFTTMCTSIPNSQSTWTIAINWAFPLLRLSVTNPTYQSLLPIIHHSSWILDFPQIGRNTAVRHLAVASHSQVHSRPSDPCFYILWC
jgi:hypothetical protein